MPEGRPFPWKFIPRLGCKLSITFGDPLSPQDLQAALSHEDFHRHPSISRGSSCSSSSEDVNRAERMGKGITHESIGIGVEEESTKRKMDHVRSMVTDAVQRRVETVGRRVSGENLEKAK